jgi:hypothetical protein
MAVNRSYFKKNKSTQEDNSVPLPDAAIKHFYFKKNKSTQEDNSVPLPDMAVKHFYFKKNKNTQEDKGANHTLLETPPIKRGSKLF